MTNDELREYDLKKSYLYPIVRLERVLSSRTRAKIYHSTIGLLIFFLVVIVGIVIVNRFDLFSDSKEVFLDLLLPKVFGLVLLMFVFWVNVFLLEAFFRSYYFKEKEDNTINGRDHRPEDMFSFQVLRIFLAMRNNDLTDAFINAPVGREILHRAGVHDDLLENFAAVRDTTVTYPLPAVVMGQVYSLVDLSAYVFDHDQAFADFLFSIGVQKDDLLGATSWIIYRNEGAKHHARWWSHARLQLIKGLGADWSYGQAYVLNRYAQEISGHEGGASLGTLSHKGEKQVQLLKDLLSRARESNVLLVGEPGEGKMDLVYAFARDVQTGAVPFALEHKRPMMFDGEMLVSNSDSKNGFETTLIRILNDAVSAGNILLVFNNFPAFVQSARQIGSDVISLMDAYLGSSQLQIITLTDKARYHDMLEQDPVIKQRFERILVESPEDNEMIQILEKVADKLEAHSGVVFTYGALKETIKMVYDHFSEPTMPDKAIDILVELPARVLRERRMLVEKQDVYKIIEQKTGVPLGKIEDGEKQTLLNMEEALHKRVVGQDEAIEVVSNAMRRSRSGVRNAGRPIGSFLFIGPTGVGKTETAKALAALFFGDEKHMIRLDMSEFGGEDAVSRLIGSYEGSKTGVLARTLSERPYGVVLLDEFEKSSLGVHDLFLQILDEGFFTDVRGKKVNARDVIFIATSNAGSSLIFQRMQEGIDMTLVQKEVIGHIIESHVFKAEFINRFDAVVLFHPLVLEHIEQIAALMLEKLRIRLRGRGLDMTVTHDLVKYVAQQGVDPVFGARPMNRYIQEHVEQVIAEKLIRGDIREGSTFVLSPSDLD
jgi:ATP-dependent Clp protease ATP-binding subunit ClpC